MTDLLEGITKEQAALILEILGDASDVEIDEGLVNYEATIRCLLCGEVRVEIGVASEIVQRGPDGSTRVVSFNPEDNGTKPHDPHEVYEYTTHATTCKECRPRLARLTRGQLIEIVMRLAPNSIWRTNRLGAWRDALTTPVKRR